MPIKIPPALIAPEALTGNDIASHAHYLRVTDERGRYLPFDQFRFRTAASENVVLAWTLTRLARNAALTPIDFCSTTGKQAGFLITPQMAAACELADKQATRLALDDMLNRLHGVGAALGALELDEPVNSSQLEGANTTAMVARNMLETGRSPRTEDEKMIVGNARLMAEIQQLLTEPLTPELIRRIHAAGMSGIDDAKYHPGQFRTSDEIVIMDYDDNIVHQPPAAVTLPERLQTICEFINADRPYIHPLVKGCMLHFMIAYEHPFRDGNGRTSRGLFYWYMLKSGYDALRFVSISQLLSQSPAQYAHSYQYTETDGMDLTYFLDYQGGIISRALERLILHVDSLCNRSAAIDRMLFNSGTLKRLSPRQVTLLNIMLATPDKLFSVAETARALGIADNTARNDFRKLKAEQLVEEYAVNDQKTAWRVARDFPPWP